MTQEERIRAVIDCGFTERQARFLVFVMRHGGVCIPRQYAGFAGIANGGRRCNAFFDRLVREVTPTKSGVCTIARGSITSITRRCISSSARCRVGIAGPCRCDGRRSCQGCPVQALPCAGASAPPKPAQSDDRGRGGCVRRSQATRTGVAARQALPCESSLTPAF
jgi:hypothetical protein